MKAGKDANVNYVRALLIFLITFNISIAYSTQTSRVKKSEVLLEDSLQKKKTLQSNSISSISSAALANNEEGLLKSKAGHFNLAIVCFTKAIQLDSSLAIAFLNRADAKKQLMDYQSALSDYNHAIKMKLTWEESYEAYYNRGLTLSLLSHLKEALSSFSYAIKLNPEYADAYFNRSIAKGMIGDYPGELEDINKSLSYNPNDPLAYNSRGIVESLLGHFDDAINDFTQSIKLDKNNSSAYFNRALIYYDKKEYLNALNDFNMALYILPDAEILNRRANVKCRLNDTRGAYEDYNAALKLQPGYYIAYLNRGCLNLDMKYYPAAIEDFTNAIRLKPDFALAYYQRGLARCKIGDHTKEIEDYSFAIEFKPDYQNAYAERGMAKYQTGDRTGGCTDLNRAVKLGSDVAYMNLIEYCK